MGMLFVCAFGGSSLLRQLHELEYFGEVKKVEDNQRMLHIPLRVNGDVVFEHKQRILGLFKRLGAFIALNHDVRNAFAEHLWNYVHLHASFVRVTRRIHMCGKHAFSCIRLCSLIALNYDVQDAIS